MKKGKINWTWKKIVGTVLGILGIGTITSCYGMPEDDYDFSIYGHVNGKINGTETAIPDIVVELYGEVDSDSDEYTTKVDLIKKTDASGNFYFYDLEEGTYTLRLTDTDGDTNGSFKQHMRTVTLSKDLDLTIKLDSAE